MKIMDSISRWYQLAGLQEFTFDIPVNRFAVRRETDVQPAKTPIVQTENFVLAPERKSSIAKPSSVPVKIAVNAADLDELRMSESRYDGCDLKRTARQMVFADGCPTANIMFMGEAPGAEEDRLGKPFVGRAGHLLDKMMTAIGLDRTNSYITNIIPYRPPGNRDPSDAERATFLPFALKHVELINPRLLVFLGRISAGAVLGHDIHINRCHGNFEELLLPNGKKVMTCVTFHPSYLLRQPSFKRMAWYDWLSIKNYLDNL